MQGKLEHMGISVGVDDLLLVAESIPESCASSKGQWRDISLEYAQIQPDRPLQLVVPDFLELWVVHWFLRQDGQRVLLHTDPPLVGDERNKIALKTFQTTKLGGKRALPNLNANENGNHVMFVEIKSSCEYLAIWIRPKHHC